MIRGCDLGLGPEAEEADEEETWGSVLGLAAG